MRNGRRVAFFDDHPHMDTGATRWTRTAAAELVRRGWHVTIIFPYDGVAVTRAREEGLDVEVVASAAALRRYGERGNVLDLVRTGLALPPYWLRVFRVVRRVADVVHINDHRGLVLAAPAVRLARRKLVWHVHTAHGSRVLNRWGSRLADAVVTPSPPTRDASPGLTAAVGYLPNAVDDRWLAHEPARARGVGETPVVASIGRLHPIKGFDVLVRAAARLRADDVDLRLVIVGGDQLGHEAYAESLRRLPRELAIEMAVDFAGEVADPLPLLQAATIYAQPSRFEPGGLAVVEAMALGLPVVATAVGGMRDTVVDGRTGWLVPADDVDALARALQSALADRTESCRRGAAGRERAGGYTVAALGDRLVELYDRVLATT